MKIKGFHASTLWVSTYVCDKFPVCYIAQHIVPIINAPWLAGNKLWLSSGSACVFCVPRVQSSYSRRQQPPTIVMGRSGLLIRHKLRAKTFTRTHSYLRKFFRASKCSSPSISLSLSLHPFIHSSHRKSFPVIPFRQVFKLRLAR